MLPAVAFQMIAPVLENCRDWPRLIEAVAGVTASTAGVSLTEPVAEPPGPVAVIVTAVLLGRVAGVV